MLTTVADRELRANISWTSKIVDASVLLRPRRYRLTYEQMMRGQLRPPGISRRNMVYVRWHATQMVKIYKRYDRVQMTSEEREKFEAEILLHKNRPISENFALLSLGVQRVEGKVDKVIDMLGQRLPPQP